jgi:hypothetical protein
LPPRVFRKPHQSAFSGKSRGHSSPITLRSHRPKSYGGCPTHSDGHYETWTSWQALSFRERAAAGLPDIIAASEYDEWPRGRIVYETSSDRFVIYCDVRLMRRRTIDRVKTSFGLLEHNVVVMADSHYR